ELPPVRNGDRRQGAHLLQVRGRDNGPRVSAAVEHASALAYRVYRDLPRASAARGARRHPRPVRAERHAARCHLHRRRRGDRDRRAAGVRAPPVTISRKRVALWLWMIWAVVVWNVVFDRVIVVA